MPGRNLLISNPKDSFLCTRQTRDIGKVLKMIIYYIYIYFFLMYVGLFFVFQNTFYCICLINEMLKSLKIPVFSAQSDDKLWEEWNLFFLNEPNEKWQWMEKGKGTKHSFGCKRSTKFKFQRPPTQLDDHRSITLPSPLFPPFPPMNLSFLILRFLFILSLPRPTFTFTRFGKGWDKRSTKIGTICCCCWPTQSFVGCAFHPNFRT